MIIRSSAMVCVLVLALAACDAREDRPAPRQVVKNPGNVPAPPPPPPPLSREGTEFVHPLYRFPPRPSPNDPVWAAVPPMLKRSVPPKYTDEARKARIQGIVILQIVVEPDGRVSQGTVLKPLPFDLAQRAIEAVQQWRYSPAKDDRGRPVRAHLNVAVEFRLP